MSAGSAPIGRVEILRTRIYPLDAESTACKHPHSEVIVEPGTYDLYNEDGATFWLMRGVLNRRGVWRMGDGLFALNANDDPSEILVVFPSQRFGPDEWAALVAGPECSAGPQQRLRVTLTAEGGTA